MYKNAILILSVILILTGCGSSEKSAEDIANRKINIVSTIGMINDIVKNVGGTRVSAVGLMGPGVDPHLYKASEGDVTRMAEADIIFYNGLHLEGAMTEVFEQMQRTVKTMAVTDGIPDSLLLSPEYYEGAHDPHIWFNVSLWMHAVKNVSQALIEMDSTHQDIYKKNTADYLKKLEQLQAYVQERAAEVPENQRVLISAHDAFNYFGRAYGFEVRGLQGISTVSEAGTADVQDLAKFIAGKKIPAIFIESSVPQRNIEAVQAAVKARGFNVKIGGELFSDAMGEEGTVEGTYIGMVRHNINTIVDALTSK